MAGENEGFTNEVSPEKEFEDDVLSQYDYQDPEPISDDPDDQAETPDGDSERDVDGETDDSDYETAPDQPEEPARADGSPVAQDNQEQSFKIKSDQKGNLIDANGKIIARAGSERRLYEAKEKVTKEYQRLQKDYAENQNLMADATQFINQLKSQLDFVKNNSLQGQHQINDQEATEAFKVYNMLKNDQTALEGAKYVLTKLAERGINIQSLGAGSGAIDPAVLSQSITSQINQQLQPITERFTKQTQEEASRAEAQQYVEGFFRANPDATPHRQTLTAMLKDPRFRGMSLPEAWSNLERHLLRQQVAQMQQPQPEQSPQQPAPEPRPNGRQRPQVQASRQSVDNSPMHAEMTYRDIVNSLVSDYGTNIE